MNVENVGKKRRRKKEKKNVIIPRSISRGIFYTYALKRQEREEITERTRLMTVPLSVSNISGTAFISATSAVRSHGHRRRY